MKDALKLMELLDELIEHARKTTGAESVLIVLLTLRGSINGGLDDILANELQKIIQEKLAPAMGLDKDLEDLKGKLQEVDKVLDGGNTLDSPPELKFDARYNLHNNLN